MPDQFESDLFAAAALTEPIRRQLYDYVALQDESVSRDQAADALGIAHHVAKFHLDKLVDEGLLQVEYKRLSGLQGPGAGRPSKLYFRSGRQVEISIPAKHYSLVGSILAQAVEDSAGSKAPIMKTVDKAARQAGRKLGERYTANFTSTTDQMGCACAVLAEQGYEPVVEEERITLHNCPFHELAEDHTQLVCAINLAMLETLFDTAAPDTFTSCLQPHPSHCCVQIRRAQDKPQGSMPSSPSSDVDRD